MCLYGRVVSTSAHEHRQGQGVIRVLTVGRSDAQFDVVGVEIQVDVLRPALPVAVTCSLDSKRKRTHANDRKTYLVGERRVEQREFLGAEDHVVHRLHTDQAAAHESVDGSETHASKVNGVRRRKGNANKGVWTCVQAAVQRKHVGPQEPHRGCISA